MITHYDLFAGIGGFSLALDQVFYDQKIDHIFCEWEPFPTAVLRKHWPDGTFYGDINDLVADTEKQKVRVATPHPISQIIRGESRNLAQTEQSNSQESKVSRQFRDTTSGGCSGFTLLTGGFPCQPFSHAGRRQGTSDDRYLWPQMLRVIQNTKPDWIIAENVRGLVTWNEGMVLETVCADLEAEGYEVQPIIIPAVAVGAPHRRDRVWIVGTNTTSRRWNAQPLPQSRSFNRKDDTDVIQSNTNAPNPRQQLREPWSGEGVEADTTERTTGTVPDKRGGEPDWSKDWREVALATCHDGVDDELSKRMVRLPDGTKISHSKWRKEALKAYGNAIVPTVAEQIFTAIKSTL